jgi:uncharacterized protein
VSVPAEQAAVAAFLARETGRTPQETHVSAVFVGARDVFKLKKAVRLPFLDFTTLERRRHFLDRELAVNRRGAPDLYREVVAIRRVGDRLVLGGEEGEVVEHVLRMAPVPEEDFLEAIVAAGRVTPVLLDALGDAVAAYHAGLAPVAAGDPHAVMVAVAEGNVRAAREAGLPEAQVAGWRAGMLAELDARRDWLRMRAAAGFVRRAHGDLHLGNLCLWNGRPVPFDALEFDEAMATIDLGYDLAFLLMDLDLRVGRGAANRVMNRALARSGDWGMQRGLPVFLSMRAMVRAHVEQRRGKPAAQYLDAALAYLRPAAGVVVAIGGLQGTGKTTLARLLAPELGPAPGAVHLRSDELRKRLHGRDFDERLPADAYSVAANERTNVALLAAARLATESGQAVIVDATFLDPAQRQAVAAAGGARFRGFWLDAPIGELERRIAARQGDASDATIEVLREAAARSPGAGEWVAVDATDREAALGAIRAHVAAC